jgi:uncharacterized membrane protein YbhN (UPF0104 family)
MHGKLRRWWPVGKALVGLAILFYLGRAFARDLSRPDLWEEPIHLRPLLPAAVLYVAGLMLSALYWRRLLGKLGARPSLLAACRAYFVGQMGKYVPGKALALVLRAALLRRTVHPGLAVLTAFYEVLSIMAAGALLAVVLFAALGAGNLALPDAGSMRRLWEALANEGRTDVGPDPGTLVAAALVLVALTLPPIVPPVFNRLSRRMSLPFRERFTPPPVGASALAEGLLLTAPAWPFFGVALALSLNAVPGAGLPWDVPTLARLTAVMAMAYVAGFVVLISPGALGVREAFLTLLLTPELAARHNLAPDVAHGKVLLAVLLLRLAWTSAEVLIVFGFWLLDVGLWILGAGAEVVPRSHPDPREADLQNPQSNIQHSPSESCSPS